MGVGERWLSAVSVEQVVVEHELGHDSGHEPRKLSVSQAAKRRLGGGASDEAQRELSALLQRDRCVVCVGTWIRLSSCSDLPLLDSAMATMPHKSHLNPPLYGFIYADLNQRATARIIGV